jgi:hypothetical protein
VQLRGTYWRRDDAAHRNAAATQRGSKTTENKEAIIGGLGSGRRAHKLSVEDCRLLEIGELCDAGRWASQPGGRVLWLTKGSAVERASLTYTIAREGSPEGLTELFLTLIYRATPQAPAVCGSIMLDVAEKRSGTCQAK